MKVSSTYLWHTVGFCGGILSVIPSKYSTNPSGVIGNNDSPITKLSFISIGQNPIGRMLFAHRMSTSPSGYLLEPREPYHPVVINGSISDNLHKMDRVFFFLFLL